MANSPRYGDRISTVVKHMHHIATIISTAGTVNSVFIQKRIYDPVKSYYEGAGEIPPELIRKIYFTMQEISSTKMALMEEDALEKGG